jgi:hypothetical protein
MKPRSQLQIINSHAAAQWLTWRARPRTFVTCCRLNQDKRMSTHKLFMPKRKGLMAPIILCYKTLTTSTTMKYCPSDRHNLINIANNKVKPQLKECTTSQSHWCLSFSSGLWEDSASKKHLTTHSPSKASKTSLYWQARARKRQRKSRPNTS